MTSLKKIKRVNDICLFVDDFEMMLDFYQNKFGLEVRRLQPSSANPNYAEFKFADSTVTMWAKSGLATVLDLDKHVNGPGQSFMIAIKVESVQDVDDIHAELVANGVKCIKEPHTFVFGSRAAYYTDPENNIWEIFAWLEGEGPGVL